MIFNTVLENIEKGKLGDNIGLDIGLPGLIDYIPNLQKENMYLVGGETSTGKSAFVYNHFLYAPYEDWKKNYEKTVNFKAFVWSMEMSKDIVITKAVCRRIFLEHKILVDVNYILSRGKNRINDEIYQLVLSTRKYFEEFEDRVIILPAENPTGVRSTLLKYLNNTGKVLTKTINIKNKDGSEEVLQVFDKYVSNHPDQYIIAIVDHMALLKKERGFAKKEVIDKMTEYFIALRNEFKIIPIMVQQLNRDLSSSERFKQGRVSPQISDFKESSDTTDAANYVLALFSPMRYDLTEYKGYNIEKLRNRFRTLSILKSRDGTTDIVKGLAFLGENGIFRELPKPQDMTEEHYKQIESIKKYG